MIRVTRSAVIDAPIERVWAVLRDFNSHAAWHPAVAESTIEGGEPADQVGCIRNFSMRDGGRLREQLLALSDYEFSMTYNILESPMDLTGYIATLRLFPVTDGDGTFVEWTAEFDCAPERAAPLARQIGEGVFQAAFDNLNRMMAGPVGAAARR